MPTAEEIATQSAAFVSAMDNNIIDTFEPAPFEQEQVTETQTASEATETVEATETQQAEETTESVATEQTEAQQSPQVVEKIVEKIVEKYPEMDDNQRWLFDAIQNGKEDDVYGYLAEKRRNYTTMSDHDIVKEGLKKDNPDWTDKRLDLEFKSKYDIKPEKDLSTIDQELDPEGYEKAVAFNEEVAQKKMLLEMQAEDYRIKLENQKKNIQLPKITEAVQAQKEPTAEEIAEATKAWETLVDTEVPKLSDLKFTVNGEDVVYKVTDEEKKALTATMKNFSAIDYLTERGWFDKDGNPNILRITEDVYKLDNEGKVLGSVATQIKTVAKREVISKDIKNLDLETIKNGTVQPKPAKTFEQVAYGAGRDN